MRAKYAELGVAAECAAYIKDFPERLRWAHVVIARAGVPVVRLVPVQRLTQRKLGQWQGRVKLADDFNEPLPPEELKAWDDP